MAASDNSDALTQAILERFKSLFDGPPEWAFPLPPPVPLIGHEYRAGEGMLIYASAENLASIKRESEDGRLPDRFKGEDAWNRYRAGYEKRGLDRDSFFPIGMLSAGLFVAERLGLPTADSQESFLETISFTNWCKFSIESGTNKDYINDVKKSRVSLQYVEAELAELEPAVVLVLKEVWEKDRLRESMSAAAPGARFIPCPQFQPRVVNAVLKRYDPRATRLRAEYENKPLQRWLAELEGFNEENAWRYMAFLDETLKEMA